MAQFRYQAVDRNGKSVRGTLEAADQVAATAALRKEGLYPVRIKAAGTSGLNREIQLSFLQRRVRLQDFVPFCRQFATLVRAGISISQSLQILAEQTENKTLKRALSDVYEEVRRGTSLQEAFSHHSKVFSEIFISMVGAGEFSGQLETMLDRLAGIFERERTTSQKLISAMTYPITVFFIAVGVSIFLLVKIVPIFTQAFAQQGVQLPLPTRITLAVSHFIVYQWYYLLLGLIVLMLGTYALLRLPQGRLFWDRVKLRLPVFGKLIRKTMIARFARTFATLVASAVPILDGLELTKRVVNNTYFEKAISEAQESLRRGEALNVPLERYRRLFPPMVTHMIAIGEETGALDQLLEKVADFYEEDVRETSNRLSSLLEPLMIVFLAVMIGTIILSIYLPMFQMMNFVQ